MSVSIHVTGFKPPDERYKRLVNAWNALEEAGLPPTPELERFFDGAEPDPAGIEVELTLREWHDRSAQGYELEVAEIPDGVKTIRFYQSW